MDDGIVADSIRPQSAGLHLLEKLRGFPTISSLTNGTKHRKENCIRVDYKRLVRFDLMLPPFTGTSRYTSEYRPSLSKRIFRDSALREPLSKIVREMGAHTC